MTHDERAPDPAVPPHELESDDAGSFVGRMPERSTETIPGGVGPQDERVSASGTRVSGGEDRERGDWPEGHREGDAATDAQVREAGQDR